MAAFWIQSIGVALALLGAWLVGSPIIGRRRAAFLVWMISNAVLGLWSIADSQWPLAAQFLAFLILNVRAYRLAA